MTLAGDLVASWGDAKSCSEEHDFKHSLNKSVTERSQMPSKQVVCRHNDTGGATYWKTTKDLSDSNHFWIFFMTISYHNPPVLSTQKLVLETP